MNGYCYRCDDVVDYDGDDSDGDDDKEWMRGRVFQT